jgi:hypothetical protein
MPELSRFRARVVPEYGIGRRRLLVMLDRRPGQVEVVTGFEFKTMPEGHMFTGDEGIPDDGNLLQAVVDAAWEAGVRPTGYSDIKNETAALREHMNDLRTVAFHALKIPG